MGSRIRRLYENIGHGGQFHTERRRRFAPTSGSALWVYQLEYEIAYVSIVAYVYRIIRGNWERVTRMYEYSFFIPGTRCFCCCRCCYCTKAQNKTRKETGIYQALYTRAHQHICILKKNHVKKVGHIWRSYIHGCMVVDKINTKTSAHFVVIFVVVMSSGYYVRTWQYVVVDEMTAAETKERGDDTGVNIPVLKRNMSRGNSLSDEL